MQRALAAFAGLGRVCVALHGCHAWDLPRDLCMSIHSTWENVGKTWERGIPRYFCGRTWEMGSRWDGHTLPRQAVFAWELRRRGVALMAYSLLS